MQFWVQKKKEVIKGLEPTTAFTAISPGALEDPSIARLIDEFCSPITPGLFVSDPTSAERTMELISIHTLDYDWFWRFSIICSEVMNNSGKVFSINSHIL
jgi:hypothetical protein